MSFNNPETSSPSFALQPANTTANATTTATLSAVVGGATPLTYQWYKGNTILNNGTATSGATISGSTTANLTLGGTGVLSTDAEATTSSLPMPRRRDQRHRHPHHLDPAILTNPAHQTNSAGATVTFTATAGGTAPVTFQWQHAGTNVVSGGTYSGVASTTLSIAASSQPMQVATILSPITASAQ